MPDQPHGPGVIANDKFFAACDEIWTEDRPGTPLDMTGDRDYERKFLVCVKLQDMTSYHVCRCPGLPMLGTFWFHPNGVLYDPLARAHKISAKQLNNTDWQFWVVTVEYSTRMPPGGPLAPGLALEAQDHPELEPADFKWGNETQREAPPHDNRLRPFINSAEMPYSPPPTFEVAYPTLTLTKNDRNFDYKKALAYSYLLNDRLFLGAPAGTAQCMPPEAEEKYRGSLRYWRVKYTIRFMRFIPVPYTVTIGTSPTTTSTTTTTTTTTSADGFTHIVTIIPPEVFAAAPARIGWRTWQPRILDAGMMYRVPNPLYDPDVPFNAEDVKPDPRTKKYNLLDIIGSSGRPVSSPVMLDGSGRQQRQRDAFGNLIPVYQDYDYYPWDEADGQGLTLFQKILLHDKPARF